MKSAHPLEKLQGKKLKHYTLCVKEVKQLHLSGWKGFALHIFNKDGVQSENPVIKGIFSTGGKDGVKPWMDVVYSEKVLFSEEWGKGRYTCLRSSEVDSVLFIRLGELIPPGGHLMVSYEEEEEIHDTTRQLLRRGVPPILTPLGFLIFLAGFQLVKDWYLAEGGLEGPRKL